MCPNINHITFNPSGTRFVMLVRIFPPKGARHDTALITANRDGSEMFLLSDYGVQSHYYWLDDERLIIYNDGKELDCSRGWANNYILTDRCHKGSVFADGFFYEDNHMSFSPVDSGKMITDTYWDERDMRRLRLCDVDADVCYEIGRFYSPHAPALDDIRCDLHPRWKQDGRKVSFDSIHEGYRGIYEADLSQILL